MAKDKEYKERRITPEKASIWAEKKIHGKKSKQIADERGKCVRQVNKDIRDFDEFIRQSPDYREAQDRLVSMIPKACDTYDQHLDESYGMKGNPDVVVATNVFKGVGLLTERNKTEHSGEVIQTVDVSDRVKKQVDNLIDMIGGKK